MDGVEVVHAPGEGDDTIAAIVEAQREVIGVTADRVLSERVRAADAEAVGHNPALGQRPPVRSAATVIGQGWSR
jgi:hypothetical protein